MSRGDAPSYLLDLAVLADLVLMVWSLLDFSGHITVTYSLCLPFFFFFTINYSLCLSIFHRTAHFLQGCSSAIFHVVLSLPPQYSFFVVLIRGQTQRCCCYSIFLKLLQWLTLWFIGHLYESMEAAS